MAIINLIRRSSSRGPAPLLALALLCCCALAGGAAAAPAADAQGWIQGRATFYDDNKQVSWSVCVCAVLSVCVHATGGGARAGGCGSGARASRDALLPLLRGNQRRPHGRGAPCAMRPSSPLALPPSPTPSHHLTNIYNNNQTLAPTPTTTPTITLTHSINTHTDTTPHPHHTPPTHNTPPQGSCQYKDQIPELYAAWPDTLEGFKSSCGRCLEVACVDRDFSDGYGERLQRTGACYDAGRTVVVKIVDRCADLDSGGGGGGVAGGCCWGCMGGLEGEPRSKRSDLLSRSQ